MKKTTLNTISKSHPWLENSYLFSELKSENEEDMNQRISVKLCHHTEKDIVKLIDVIIFWVVEYLPLEVYDRLRDKYLDVDEYLDTLSNNDGRLNKLLKFIEILKTGNRSLISGTDMLKWFQDDNGRNGAISNDKFPEELLIEASINNDVQIIDWCIQNQDKIDFSKNFIRKCLKKKELNDTIMENKFKAIKLFLETYIALDVLNVEQNLKCIMNYGNVKIGELFLRKVRFATTCFTAVALMCGNIEILKYAKKGKYIWNKNFTGFAENEQFQILHISQEEQENQQNGENEIFPQLVLNNIVNYCYEILGKLNSIEIVKWCIENNGQILPDIYSEIFEHVKLNELVYLGKDTWHSEIDFEKSRAFDLFFYLIEFVPLTAKLFIQAMKLRNFPFLKFLIDKNIPIDLNVFASSIQYENFELLELLFPYIADTFSDSPNSSKCTLYACIVDNIEILKWLLERNFPISKGCLGEAAKNQNIEMINFLYTQRDDFNNPILGAVFSGNVEILKFVFGIFKQIPKVDFIIDLAVGVGNIEILNLLYDLGYRSSDLHIRIAEFGDIEILKWYISKGFELNHEILSSSYRVKNYRLFKYAIENGCIPSRSFICTVTSFENKNNMKYAKLILQYSQKSEL